MVTCAACHGGTIDQNAGHFGNWAGTAMASAARDPVFRANNLIVNEAVKNALGGKDGAGNMCWRCHSPNGWYSGRFDPTLAGQADGSTMLHSIVASTDDEGIMCEVCHRTIGGVTMKRSDLNPNDPVWNMMAGIDDWPHNGNPYPEGPVAGNPYGDTTLQINDGMTYGGKYSGTVNIWFSDIPTTGTYTGQTYGIYPPATKRKKVTGSTPVINPDGSTPIHYEDPIGPPDDPDYQAISLEHPTFGGQTGTNNGPTFIRTPEFCGSCHDLTIPVLNHGMPEQRTYTEWKYSNFGRQFITVKKKQEPNPNYKRCQDCHMPTLKHEYADDVPVSLNPDPVVSGWWPYAKDRNLTIDPVTGKAGTTFHKFGGGNRDLPEMMKYIYKDPITKMAELDLEVIGEATYNDTRMFPGMLSNRESHLDRARRNTEIMLKEAVSVQITEGPISLGNGKYRVKVKVTNNSGHRIPTGYPDGRRFWISLQVKDANGNTVYQSGYYDPETAELYNDAGKTGFKRALDPMIDATTEGNQVMVYEKRTGTAKDGGYEISVSLLNEKVVFDNRIPPAGFTYADYYPAGAKFVTYQEDILTGLVTPVEDTPNTPKRRYPDGQNWDEVTYIFTSTTTPVSARAEIQWQSHTREFMEYLRTSDTSTLRPKGPPSRFNPNYPQPYYLSDHIPGFLTLTSLDGQPLQDNWGGIAYAA